MRTATALCLLAALAAADTLVLRDQSILAGAVTKGENELVLDGRKVPLVEVLLWEGDDGALRHSPTVEAQMRAYRILTNVRVVAACEEKLPAALAAGVVTDARDLLEQAERAGLELKEAESWDQKIDRAKAGEGGGEFRVDARGMLLDFLVERARKTQEVDPTRELRILRAVLRTDKEHAAALARLKELKPTKWRIGDERTWLDWKLDVLSSPSGRIHTLRRKNYDLDVARRAWRTDLHGAESSDIVFITPLEDSTTVGKCVSMASITCAALEKLFFTENPAREDTDPLVIYFYENREEYVKLSRGQKVMGPGPMIANSAGHYSSVDNIARFFWPDTPDPEHSIQETFVHELTHHWINRRCPRWHPRDVAPIEQKVTTPGFWIVEGIAVFMQEGVFDTETGGWSHFDPHSMMLDIVAKLGPKKKLLDWERLYTVTQIEWNRTLEVRKPHANYHGRWFLRGFGLSEMILAYKQSGATCHFLYYGEEGRYRPLLIDYVTAYYTGKKSKTDTSAAFGLTPAELGAKVEAHARAVADGWRPKS